MRYLLGEGYQCLSLDAVVSITQRQLPLPERAFCLTFDDGYLDNWLYLYPLLEELNLSATVFLITNRVEGGESPRVLSEPYDSKRFERSAGGFLSWSEIRAMQKRVVFGSHTQSHRNFVRREPYADWRKELSESKAIIEKHLSQPCRHVAWPWGDFHTVWEKSLPELGYISACTTLGGANTSGSDPFRLRRIGIRRERFRGFKVA